MRQNHVFIAESANNLVRRADLAANQIHDLVGISPDPGSKPISAWKLSSPTGVAVAGQNLFITDASNNRTLRVNLVTGATRVVAGTGVAGYDGDVTIATRQQGQFPDVAGGAEQHALLLRCSQRKGSGVPASRRWGG